MYGINSDAYHEENLISISTFIVICYNLFTNHLYVLLIFV